MSLAVVLGAGNISVSENQGGWSVRKQQEIQENVLAGKISAIFKERKKGQKWTFFISFITSAKEDM